MSHPYKILNTYLKALGGQNFLIKYRYMGKHTNTDLFSQILLLMNFHLATLLFTVSVPDRLITVLIFILLNEAYIQIARQSRKFSLYSGLGLHLYSKKTENFHSLRLRWISCGLYKLNNYSCYELRALHSLFSRES